MLRTLFCRQKTTVLYEYFFIAFGTVILQIKDFEGKGMLEIRKTSSKTGDRFTAISDLQDNGERVLCQTETRQLR